MLSPGDIWPCLETILVVSTGRGGAERGRRGIYWEEAGDSAKTSYTVPHIHIKSYPASNVNSAEVEKACSLSKNDLHFLFPPLQKKEGRRSPLLLSPMLPGSTKPQVQYHSTTPCTMSFPGG